MKLKKAMKGFTAVVIVAALSVGGMTLALASDQDVEEVAEEEDSEDAEAVDISSLKAVDPETGQEVEILLEEDAEPAVDEPEAEPASSETDSSDQASDDVSVPESTSEPDASETNSEPAASETEAEPAASEEEAEPEAEEAAETEEEEAAETPEPEVSEPEEQNVEENTETVTGTITDVEPVETISAEELLNARKEGIYVALRNAGMSHVGAASVMGVMDATSEFDVSEGGLCGWTDEWKDALDEYSGDHSSSHAYQVAFLLETIENPEEVIETEEEEEINFDYLKAALMSDDSYVMTDVWYFIQYYSNRVNPDNEIDINDCLKLAREYVKEYEPIKDSYENLTTVFEMTESAGGQSVAEYACSFVGNPYVWGGSSLTNGCDCSGFIMSVYAHFGVSLPHYSGSLRSVGYEVSPAEMQPGDIVCYSGHCAIYIGDGRIVHASNSQPYPVGGIKISPNYAYRTVLAIRRVLAPDVKDAADVSEDDATDIEPVVLTMPEMEPESEEA